MTERDNWQPITTAPRGKAIDVFYRNATFNPPAEGVIECARLSNGFWLDARERGVPAEYVTRWKATKARVHQKLTFWPHRDTTPRSPLDDHDAR